MNRFRIQTKSLLSASIFIGIFFGVLWIPSAPARITITDDVGKTIVFDKPFTRIISLYAGHTRNLKDMGIEKELIGISKNDREEGIFNGKTVFSYSEDPEKFMAASPDLVLIRPMISQRYDHFVKKLELAGITVISLQPTDIDGMYAYWKTLGQLTGKKDEAIEMIRLFKETVGRIRRHVEKIPEKRFKRVYFEAIHHRMKTFSSNSMAMFVLETAGGIPVSDNPKPVRNSNIAFYGKEKILSHADEIDVYLAQYGQMNPVTIGQILEEPGFQTIKAVKNGDVYLVDETKVSRPTLQLLEGICDIGRILYQDVFSNTDICSPLLGREDFWDIGSYAAQNMKKVPFKVIIGMR